MDHFTASVSSGLLRLHWASGTFISYDIAVQAARALESLSGGQALPLLVNVMGVTGLAPEARAGMNAYRGFSVVALVGDHPMGTVLTAFAQQSLSPTAYFTAERDALAWLTRQLGSGPRTVEAWKPDPSGTEQAGPDEKPGTSGRNQ
jgi:hypothetical protein